MIRPRHLTTCYQKSNNTSIHVKNIQKLIIQFDRYFYGLLAPIVKEVFTKRIRRESRAAATSKMERFVITVNGFQPLAIITKRCILDVAG